MNKNWAWFGSEQRLGPLPAGTGITPFALCRARRASTCAAHPRVPLSFKVDENKPSDAQDAAAPAPAPNPLVGEHTVSGVGVHRGNRGRHGRRCLVVKGICQCTPLPDAVGPHKFLHSDRQGPVGAL